MIPDPRFPGDDQSDLGAVRLSQLPGRKRRLGKSNFFFLGGPAGSQPAPPLTTISPSSAFSTTELKGLPACEAEEAGFGLPSA